MIEKTDIGGVRHIAKVLLYTDIKQTNIPFIIHHPIFSTPFWHGNNSQMLNLLLPDELSKARKDIEKRIDKGNLLNIYMLINKPYRLTFVKYIMSYVDLRDFSYYFADAWIMSENPNNDPNCSLTFLVNCFKKADKQVLMPEEDYQIYQGLPQEVRLYRGIGVNRNKKGLSWTDDLELAEWFANRFNTEKRKGYVLTANVPKEHILAYFNTRNEKEYVCDTRKLTVERL